MIRPLEASYLVISVDGALPEEGELDAIGIGEIDDGSDRKIYKTGVVDSEFFEPLDPMLKVFAGLDIERHMVETRVARREAVGVAVPVVDQPEHEPRTCEAEDQGFPGLALLVDDLGEREDLAIPGGATGEIEHRQRDVMDCVHLVTLTFVAGGTGARAVDVIVSGAGRLRAHLAL